MLAACRYPLSICKAQLPISSLRECGKPSCALEKHVLRHPFNLSLCVVTERKCVKNEEEFFSKFSSLIQPGGVTMVQLWDHVEDIRPSIKTAYKMKEMLSGRGIPLIINNRVDVALAVNAEGVHLGQRDFPYQEARRLLGKRAILGFTVDTFEDVIAAENLDVDYLGVQVFPSKNTKPNHTHLWGIEGLRKVKSFSRHRVLAIGGINVDNLKAVATHLSLGPEGDGVAMVGQLWRGENPYGVAQRVHSIFNERWGGK